MGVLSVELSIHQTHNFAATVAPFLSEHRLITEHTRRLVADFFEIEEQKPFSRKRSICLEKKTKWLEPLTVKSLSLNWRAQRKKEEARRKLQQIFGWFKEGFDTKDLLEAKNILQELGAT